MVMKRYLLAIMILLLPALAAADVTLQLDRDEATTADVIRLTLSVDERIKGEPQIEGLDAFRVSSGGTSSSTQIINGQMSRSIGYTYYLQATRPGSYRIGPAHVRIGRDQVSSNVVQLNVKEPAKVDGQGPLFMTVGLSRDAIYAGEQAVYTIKFYRQHKVDRLDLQLPEIAGIEFKRLGDSTEYQSNVDGQNYRVIEVRYAVIAAQPGTYDLGQPTISMLVYYPDARDSFFSMSRPVTIEGNALRLQVLDLPLAGRPAGFSGLLGSFKISSSLEPAELKTGETASLTVEVKGLGNVRQIPDLELPEIPGIKIYADQPELVSGIRGEMGSKTMKWALVPEKAGSFVIPPLDVAFFDVDAAAYRTISSESYLLNVLPGAATAVQLPALADNKHAIEDLGSDILPLHRSMSALKQPIPTALWLALITLPLMIYLLILIMQRLSGPSEKQQRARRASKAFAKLKANPGQDAAGQLEALRNYLNDRLDLEIGVLTSAEVERYLPDATALKELVNQLNAAVYSGQQQGCSDMLEIVAALEKELK